VATGLDEDAAAALTPSLTMAVVDAALAGVAAIAPVIATVNVSASVPRLCLIVNMTLQS
jgi:hypothetical protein